MIQNKKQRRGVTTVELAVIAPLVFMLIVGLVVGGMGVFRYQQVASLAREGARYASVRGTEYAANTKLPAATAESVHKEVILARSVGLDPKLLTSTVSWDRYNSPQTVNADNSVSGNIVIVTVNYLWIPEAYLGGIVLSSTSKLPMSH
jgi:Flp pilus assembly protein TadG